MTEPVNITLLLDRFLSASTAADVQNALEHVLSALQDPSATEALLAEPDVLKGMLKLLATQSYKNVGVEDGDNLCARILWQILQTSDTAKTLLQRPELALIEVLMDVAATNEDESIERSSYTRVLCLQSLEKLCHQAPQLAQQQLLQAPNGLHRLGELLHCADLAVRNQALLVAHCCAAWPAVSQVWIFLNIVPTLLQVALQEGGLQGGTVVVQDCLRLLRNLLRHDTSMAELVFQEQTLAPQLSVLLDLRLGTEFVHPVAKKKIEPLLSRKKAVDDLDDLLMEPSSNQESSSDEEIILPRLTRDEEKVIHAVLDILELVLENNKVRQAICTQDLASMVWELGLVNFPPPGVAAPCAYPSASLQQRALQITARYLNDPILLQNHNALHRLLHLVCMGGIPKDREDKLGVSQSALHLLRQTVPPAQAQEILLNTLAPPLTEETPDLTPVQRLLITVENNLVAPPDTGRTVLLVGSTCALSLFLVDTASREMMVRLMDSGLLPSILELLPNEPDTLVTLVLLRFLCQWMDGSPLVVQSILGAPQSATVLAALLESKDSTIAAYASLLLGMALNQMTDQQDVTKYGGWTREGILDIFKHSLKLFLLRLDELGPNLNMWSFCPLEHKVWLEEFQANVWTVRRCLVAEMTVHSESSDEISSMQALIEKQSSELEELRQELNFSKKSLVQQEKELLLWKVRAECTPTQLDELLNQSTSRNTALEKKVEELESLLYHIEAEHAADVSRNTELVESLQAEVQNALQNETQTREDLETMQGEMTALSQAYTNLEAEYRRQTELLSTSTAGAEGSEQSAHQNQGEDSEKELSRGNSTEVAILRAENTRLKNDMKVAEDWMAMAHQKLSEILTENTALKGEVSSLRGQVQSLGDQSAGLQQELNSLREYYGSSSNEDLRSIISKTSQQAELETNLREEAESELIHIRGLLEKVEKDKADLEQRMSEMNQMFISENAATFGHSQPKTLPAENDTVNLHEEVEAVRKELAFVLKREEEAISNRDARISELESCLDERGFPSEELLRRDKEIEELKQLTQVAQEWMDNAIEQYHALQQDKEALLSEKATLTNQLSELDNQIQTLIPSISMATAQPDLQALTLALQEKDSLLKESMATLSEMQVSLTEKEHNLDSLRFELQSANEEIQQKCSELELLRQNSNSAANEIQHLRAQAKALTSREQELCKEIDDLRNGQSSNQDLVEGLHVEENSSQSNLLLQIEEYKTMMRNLEAQLSEQECDSNDMVKEWETTYTDLEKRHKEVLGEKQKLEDLCSAKDARIYELQDENRSKNDEVNELTILLEEKVRVMSTTNIVDTGEEENREDKDATIKTLSDEVETLKQQLQAMDAESVDAISRWQASYADLEARYLELCNSKETPVVDGKDAVQLGLEDGSVDRVSELTSQVTRLQQALTEAESESAAVVAKWQEAYAELEDKVRVASADESGMGADVQASNDALSDRVSELNALVTSLQEQLREADAEHATVLEKWQQGYAELEEKVRVMSTTNIVDTGEEENREDKDATIKTLSDEVKTLKQQLQAMDAESVDAISRWQASYADLEARYLELCNSKETPVVDGKDAVQLGLEDGSVDRVSELTSQVTRLQQALTEAESESAAVVAKWQEAYAELEDKVRVASADESGMGADVQASNDALSDRVSELNALVTSLQEQLREADAEHATVLEKWQQGYAELEEKVRVMSTTNIVDTGEEENREDKDATIKTLTDEVETLKQQLQAMDAESVDAISRWQASYADLEARYLELCNSKETPVVDGKDAVQLGLEDGSVDRVSELTSQVTRLQQALTEAESESAAVVAKWQEAYAELEDKVRVASADESGMGADVQASNDALSDRVSELNALVTSLQEQLREADAEHATVLEKWQQGYAELEEKVRVMSTTNIVDTGEEENREDKDATIKTLSDEVKTLKQQLQAMDAESVDAISRWQASYADLEARYLELCNSKETPVVDGKDAVQLGLEDGSVDRVSELTSQVTRLQQALTEAESESAAVVAKWQEAYAELEGKVRISSPDNNLVADISCSDKDKNLRLDDVVRQTETFKQHGQDRERYDEVSHEIALLRSQLLEQETEAQDAIRQWEISYAELEERLLKVTKEHDCALSSGSPGIVDPPFLESAADKKSMSDNEADTQIAMGDNNFLDAFRELEQRVSKLTSEVSFLQRELVDSEKEAANAISTWEQAYANLEAELQLAKKNNCERHDSEDVDDRDSLLTKMTIHIATLNEQLLLYQTQLNSRTAMNKSDQVNSQVGDSTANINDGTVTQLEVSLNTDADAAFAEQRYNEGPEESSQSSLQAEVYRLQCNIKVMQEEKQTSVAELQERLASATSEMVETKQQLGLLKTELEQNRLQANEKAEFIKQLSLERDLLSESFRRLEDQYEKDVLAFNLERKVLEDDLFSTREELNSKTMQAKKLTNDLRESQEALSQMELKMRGADEEDKLRVLLDEKTAALVLLEEDLSLKTFELQSKSAEWEKAKEREAELEREISRLQSELSDQKEEAEIAIASWETRCEELEELCKFSQDDKDKLNDALERAGTLETRLRETEELFNARLETAISEHDRVQKAIADTLRLQTQAEHERLELIVSTLQNEKAVLIAERDNLTTRVAELEDEVLESRDAMRFCITNGMSDKAFEIATQSLLEQLNQMSEQAASNAASLVMERQGRQAAEEEVRRLRSDLALILGMENGNENVAEIQKLTLKTKGYIQRKEAAEIQSLRSSLERAQAELSGSKASEMESKERSAKANIRATALEQELISSRNDFQYLVKTMEEMREAELSRRVSFEYRIDSLENDKAMLKKIQATEIDNLRNELNQICIERDRLFVSLKDSEKSKEAVMLASNRAQLSNLNEESDLHAELDILRIEKARLLAATADETLQFERRLRDAVAAERSSSEADLILEKELRLAAERSVDALKHELEQMQVDLDRPVHPDDALSTTEAIPTSHEMVELKAQIESLLMEKRNLKSQVDTIKAESQRRIEELARECREAKSEALRVERESLFEAELQAEMSRVQNNGSFRRNEVDTEESQGIFEEKKDAMQLEHLQRLYEAIKDQKETIEEERSVYFELLSEQDDLLALLAQQDLMESCLKAALCRLGGAEAVEEAAQEAREKAEAQYGKYIEVSAVEST